MMRDENGEAPGPGETSRDQTVGPRALEAITDKQLEELGDVFERADPCYSLWISVIELALRDLEFLGEKQDDPSLRSYERGKLREILKHDPRDFLRADWFEDVCGYLGVSAALLRHHAEETVSERHARE